MNLGEIAQLLDSISVHYPSFRKSIETTDGRISETHLKEWYRRIGFMDYEDADAKLTRYLSLPDGNKFPPNVSWFLNNKAPTEAKQKTFVGHDPDRKFKIEKRGYRYRLFDEEGREYGTPGDESDFYYDNMGRICQSGKVVIE